MILHANGPVHVRELARLRGVDSSSTFRSVDRLISAGLIAKREVKRRYISIDRSHRAHFAMRRLLDVLIDRFGVPRLGDERPTYRWYLPVDRDIHVRRTADRIFGTALRTQVIILVAIRGSLDLRRLSRLTGLAHCSVWHAVNALERDGVLSTRHRGQSRAVSLSPRLPGVGELRRYVASVVRTESAEYASIARLFRMSECRI